MSALAFRNMRQAKLVVGLLCLLQLFCGLFFAREALAGRVAIIVANNTGKNDDEPLKHAEADADRMAATFTQLGGVEPSDAIVVKGQGAAAVRRAFRTVATRLENTPGERVVFFYYSGHADAVALHLADSELPLAELKQLLLNLPATLRVAIVDACQSGTLTRMKGGRRGAMFDLSAANARTTGLAILSSTADGELAQESDALQGSFFTYHLDVGLRGLADLDRNGEVTLVESFDYASERTTNTTLSTSAGPQHPSFRYDLGGQGDLVISRLRGTTTQGLLVFDRPGWYFVRSSDDRLVAEVQSNGAGERLALPRGAFELLRRDTHSLARGHFRISLGKSVPVGSVTTTTVPLGRAVRKGGLGASHATTTSVAGIWRSSLVGLGPWWGGVVGLKEDFDWASFEVKAAYAEAVGDTRVPSTTSELSFALAGMRTLDLAVCSVAAGMQVGWSLFRQRVEWSPATLSHTATFAPLVAVEIPLGLRLSARGELAVPLYWLRIASNSEGSNAMVAAALQLGAGVGVTF